MIHLTTLDPDLVPVPAEAKRAWWRDDDRTRNHAEHCLPLLMANGLGWVVRSPGAFSVSWDGDWTAAPAVKALDPGVIVDAHSAGGSFTVQPGFVVSTSQTGDFVMIRPVPNCRGATFSAMEVLMEAWWQPGEFGLVCLLHRPGSFVVKRGEPLAQMCVYKEAAGLAQLDTRPELPPETLAWRERRYRPEYRKDLDYLHGLHPDGRAEPTHRRNWRRGGHA